MLIKETYKDSVDKYPTDRPKSVCNRCVIEVFGGVCVLSFGFRIFCWYRGFCHRTESYLFLFLPEKRFIYTSVVAVVAPTCRRNRFGGVSVLSLWLFLIFC